MARRIAMPESVTIGPHVFALTVSSAAVDAECVKSQRRLFAYTDLGAMKVYLSAPPNLVGSMLRETVLHECLHVMLDGNGMAYGLRNETHYNEEALAQHLDTPLLGLLRANPALVAWLVAED